MWKEVVHWPKPIYGNEVLLTTAAVNCHDDRIIPGCDAPNTPAILDLIPLLPPPFHYRQWTSVLSWQQELKLFGIAM